LNMLSSKLIMITRCKVYGTGIPISKLQDIPQEETPDLTGPRLVMDNSRGTRKRLFSPLGA
jgi:hypothetical protein